MKTPDDIKKGLEKCLARWAATHYSDCRSDCPYWGEEGVWCKNTLHSNALTYINQLEDRNEKLENALRNLANSSSNAHDAANKVIEHLKSRLAQVERERDAAIKDIPRACGYCKHCRYAGGIPFCFKKNCKNISGINTGFEWRGVCTENTKEEER